MKEKRYSYKKSKIFIHFAMVLTFIPFFICLFSLFYFSVMPINNIILLIITDLMFLIVAICSLVSFIKTLDSLKKHNLNTSKNMMIINIFSIYMQSINLYLLFGYLLLDCGILLYSCSISLVLTIISFIFYRNYWLFGSIYHEYIVYRAKLDNLSKDLINTANYYDSYISRTSYAYNKISNLHEAAIIDSLTKTNASVKNRLLSLLVPLFLYGIVIALIYIFIYCI